MGHIAEQGVSKVERQRHISKDLGVLAPPGLTSHLPLKPSIAFSDLLIASEIFAMSLTLTLMLVECFSWEPPAVAKEALPIFMVHVGVGAVRSPLCERRCVLIFH